MSVYSIGEAAVEAGVGTGAIRYYEDIGLMPPPRRTAGRQRRYDASGVRRLCFISHARALGFSLDAVRELLMLADDPSRPCSAADSIARRQLAAVEARLEQLDRLRIELRRMITQCEGGQVRDCRVIELLGDHDQCLGEHDADVVDSGALSDERG